MIQQVSQCKIGQEYDMLTFVAICSSVSVRKIEELGSLALILDLGPCRAGKNVECINAGLG